MTTSQSSVSMTTQLVPVPAPWLDMKGEAYSFYSYLRASSAPPSSAYDPLERQSDFADPEITGHFAGGLGTVMIVRYPDSPVGPYDELSLVPGEYHVPVRKNGYTSTRITRIYVSTQTSTYNGRRNWNVPKRVAEFTFTPRADGGPGYDRVEVRLPGAKKPFFAVNLVPSWLSFLKIPLNTSYLPIKGCDQPPLPEGEEPERVGTDKWMCVDPVMRGNCSLVWATGGLENGEWSDGVDFPPNQFYSMGMWWENFGLDFPVPTDPSA